LDIQPDYLLFTEVLLWRETRIKEASVHKLGGDRKTSDSTSKIHVVILTSPVVVNARIIYNTFYTLSKLLYIRSILSAENIRSVCSRTNKKKSILSFGYSKKQHLVTSITLIYLLFIFRLYYKFGKQCKSGTKKFSNK